MRVPVSEYVERHRGWLENEDTYVVHRTEEVERGKKTTNDAAIGTVQSAHSERRHDAFMDSKNFIRQDKFISANDIQQN